MDELRCPWCGAVARIGWYDEWRARVYCSSSSCEFVGPWRSGRTSEEARDEAVGTMDMVTGPCPICHEQGAPDRPRVVCQFCHEFVDGEREDAIARADAAEAKLAAERAAHGEHVAIARELLIVSDYIGMKAGLERYKRLRSEFMRSTGGVPPAGGSR